MDLWIYGCELKWIQLALLSWSSCSPQNISNPTHPAPSDFAMIGMNRALIGLMGLPGLLYKYSWYSSWSILQAGESRCLARVVHSALSPLSHYGNASSNSIQLIIEVFQNILREDCSLLCCSWWAPSKMTTISRIITSEGALRRPMTYDDNPICPSDLYLWVN